MRPGSNTDAQAEAALSLRMCLDGFLIGGWFSFTLAPLASATSALVVKTCKGIDFSKEVDEFLSEVVILVKRSNIFVVKECKSINFSKEVYEFLAKVVILVRRSCIFVVKECKITDFNKEVYEWLAKVVILVNRYVICAKVLI